MVWWCSVHSGKCYKQISKHFIWFVWFLCKCNQWCEDPVDVLLRAQRSLKTFHHNNCAISVPQHFFASSSQEWHILSSTLLCFSQIYMRVDSQCCACFAFWECCWVALKQLSFGHVGFYTNSNSNRLTCFLKQNQFYMLVHHITIDSRHL